MGCNVDHPSPLPRAGVLCRAGNEETLDNRFTREVVVALEVDGLVRVGDLSTLVRDGRHCVSLMMNASTERVEKEVDLYTLVEHSNRPWCQHVSSQHTDDFPIQFE